MAAHLGALPRQVLFSPIARQELSLLLAIVHRSVWPILATRSVDVSGAALELCRS